MAETKGGEVAFRVLVTTAQDGVALLAKETGAAWVRDESLASVISVAFVAQGGGSLHMMASTLGAKEGRKRGVGNFPSRRRC